ncbi:MAG: hypothetical protein KJ077_49080 [Anaerolineae bacterium]|nr:hypothetical protein [Anaerolineae bacterium]
MYSNFIRGTLKLGGVSGLILAGLLLSLFSISPAYAGGVVGNGTPGSCTETALNTALSGGGTVTFKCGGAKTIIFTSYKQISANTVINGGGVITLSGGNSTDLFQVFSTKALTLQNISLVNGLSKLTAAGAVENFGTTTIINSQLRNNRSSSHGGAISNQGLLTLNNVTLSNNQATDAGGAVYNDAGSVTVNNSLFLSNVISGAIGTGGGISNNSGLVVVQNSTFNHNSGLDGGAIYVHTTASLILTGSTIISNTAGYGAGIENRGLTTASQTTVTLNRATIGDGGGIWNLNGQLTLRDSTVSGNIATTTGGGISSYSTSLTLERVTVSGNTSGGNGGGIYSGAAASLINVTLSDNHTNANGGGGMFQDNGTATLNYVTVAGNTSIVFGGGVYKQGSGTMTLRDTLLTNNSVGNCDGVVGSAGHNLSSDTNCGLFTQTGDQQNVALPLGPLANNGGPSLTHRPLTGNPAINGGDCIGGIATDQRSFSRPFGSNCDVGAVEVGPVMYLPVVVK